MVLNEPILFKEYSPAGSWIERPQPGSSGSSGSSTDMGSSSSSSSPSPQLQSSKPQFKPFEHGTIPKLESFEGVSYVKNQQLGGFRATQLLALTFNVLSGRRKRRARRLFLQATFGDAPVGGIVSAQDVASARDRVALLEREQEQELERSLHREQNQNNQKSKKHRDTDQSSGICSHNEGVVDNMLLIRQSQDIDNVNPKAALLKNNSPTANKNIPGRRKSVTFAIEEQSENEEEKEAAVVEAFGVLEDPPGASTEGGALSETKQTTTTTISAAPPKKFTLALRTGPNNSTFWIGSVNELSRSSSFSSGNDGEDSGGGNGSGENGSPILIPVPVTAKVSGGGGSSSSATSASNSLRESLMFSFPGLTSVASTNTSPTLPISFFGGKKTAGAAVGGTGSSAGGAFASIFSKPNRNRGSTTAAAARKATSSESDNSGAGSRTMSLEVNNMMLVMSGKAGAEKPWKPLSASLEDLFFPKRYRRRGSKDSLSSGNSSLPNLQILEPEEERRSKGGGGVSSDGGSNSKDEEVLAEVDGEEEEAEPTDDYAVDANTDTARRKQPIESRTLGVSKHNSTKGQSSKKPRDNGFYLFPLSGVYSKMPWFDATHTKVLSDLADMCKSPDSFLVGTLQVPEQEKLVMILSEEDLEFLTNVETTTELLLHRTDFFQDTRNATENGTGSPQTYGQQWLREWQRIRGMPQEQAESIFALYMRETYLEVREKLVNKTDLKQKLEMDGKVGRRLDSKMKRQKAHSEFRESKNPENHAAGVSQR